MKLAHPLSRRSFVRIAGAGLLATSLMAAGAAAAADPQSATVEQAVALVDRPLTGRLEGNSGGSFAFYKFDYPGDGSTATVNVQITPDDPNVLRNAGIVIFAPNGRVLVRGGQQPRLSPNASGNVIFNDPNQRGSYVVQVFNYNPGTTIDFTIWVTGVPLPSASAAPAPAAPAAAAPAAQPTAAPASGNASPPAEGSNSYNGHLAPGGHTALYEFNYPGDQSVYTIGLNVTPNDPNVMRNAGFRVYGPAVGKVYVTGGYQGGLVPNVSGNVISKDAGTFVIQVYNYSQSPVDYTVTLTTSGPPGEVPPAPR